jgi:hypothetical protein
MSQECWSRQQLRHSQEGRQLYTSPSTLVNIYAAKHLPALPQIVMAANLPPRSRAVFAATRKMVRHYRWTAAST